MHQTLNHILFVFLLTVASVGQSVAQSVPIESSSINQNGQIELMINSSSDQYYILQVKNPQTGAFDINASMTLGQAGMTMITESLEALPEDYYRVMAYSIDNPGDIDGDGVDDMEEYENIPLHAPLNPATPVAEEDGLVAIDDFATFKDLSIRHELVQWSEFLNEKVFVKFMIVDFFSDDPKTYFVNSNQHDLHADFADAVGIDNLGDEVKKGQIIYHPTVISNNGTLGAYAFNYSNGNGQDFEVVERTHELLAANMPLLENNLSHFITELNTDEYERDIDLFEGSRVPILIEEDIFGEVDYWGLNPAEGFGFFRIVGLEEIPDARDIVLYESLPNSLPRVSGIMTSALQTPLSHVNLRAIQQEIPNSFVRDPLENEEIANLLNKYVYYKVEQDTFEIREASQEEVNAWFESIRPTEEQVPALDLSQTEILSLDDIDFHMYDAFGAKCANVATMLDFGFPAGTTPEGYGVPFYFYQEFMKYNGFFERARAMMEDEAFMADRLVRNEVLKEFRSDIKDAELPDWMWEQLGDMQESFPEGTSIRCRSSTNNEDLPGFNGAGLYDSKTQHPEEGHIQKSVKQVYASLWNLRAFDEREFNRVDHFVASMGILCHPNYQDEKANGVGVSVDPLYNTDGTFYLNTQVGEELITNPNGASIPEEILLDQVPNGDIDFIVIQGSSFLPGDSIILSAPYRLQMREFLTVIHDRFAELYGAQEGDNFAMDIEYKITLEDQLIIKQARPWSSFSPKKRLEFDPILTEDNPLVVYPNPTQDIVNVYCDECAIEELRVFDLVGKQFLSAEVGQTESEQVQVLLAGLPVGVYVVWVETSAGKGYARRVVRM